MCGVWQFEGFGLTPLEAMSTMSIIAHAWSGHLDYCVEPACFTVRSAFFRDDPQWPNDGIWAVADVYDAAEQMKRIRGLLKAGELGAAAEFVRKCVTQSFRPAEVVRKVFGYRPHDIEYMFVCCFRSHIDDSDDILVETKD